MNGNTDYQIFGGWLMVFYWCSIIGGIIVLLSMAVPALISIAASLLIGVIYAAGILVSVLASCVSALCNIMAAVKMKARNPQFFDTFVLGMIVSLVGSVLSGLLKISGPFGFGSFIGGVIGSVIGIAIGLCLCVMYFSKSVRVNVYFGGRPLRKSRYWDLIKGLPAFIISEPSA